MKSKLLSDIYNERKIEVICSAKNSVVWNESQEGMEILIVDTYKYL